MKVQTSTISERLAEHFSGLKWEQVPKDKGQVLKHLILDYLGVAAAGSRTESGSVASAYALTGGVPEATVITAGAKTSMGQAALANAISAHSLELDDVDSKALFHFGPPIVSAALAVAEATGASGRTFLAGVAAGCEFMNRLSDAANPALRNKGYHTTAVCGGFAATVAAGRILGLSPEQLVSALGLAGAQASGLMEMYGPSMQKRFNPGPAARNGVTAATMARMGFTGAATIFEGERGFAKAFCDGAFDPEPLLSGLGQGFPVFLEFKAYACARPIHPAIDACLELRKSVPKDLDQISEIVVRRHPAWADYHLNRDPRTYHEAQVSLPFSVGLALRQGEAFFEHYQEPYLSDPVIRRLIPKVTVVKDATLPNGVSVAVAVKVADQVVAATQVDYPRGSLQNPFTTADVIGKFERLAGRALTSEAVRKLPKLVDSIEDAPSLGQITALIATFKGS